MDCALVLKKLTEEQIRNAIGNSVNEDLDQSIETENDVAVDDNSEDESDHESAFESEADDADYEEDESTDHHEAAMQLQEFVGRDGTIWQSAPHPKHRVSHNVNRTALNKVNLIGSRRIDSAENAFDCFFTKEVIDTVVMFTNMEGKRTKNDWKEVDDIEIRAFIGLLFAAGVERASKRNYVEFYDQLRRPANISSNNGFETISIYYANYPIRR